MERLLFGIGVTTWLQPEAGGGIRMLGGRQHMSDEKELSFDVDDTDTLVGLRVERLDDCSGFTVGEASDYELLVQDDEQELVFTAAEQGSVSRFLI